MTFLGQCDKHRYVASFFKSLMVNHPLVAIEWPSAYLINVSLIQGLEFQGQPIRLNCTFLKLQLLILGL